MRRTLTSYDDGTIYVFEKAIDTSEVQSTELKIQEELFNKRFARIEDENELLDIQLKNKRDQRAKLDKQLKEREVFYSISFPYVLRYLLTVFPYSQEEFCELKHKRELLVMQLDAEIRNSNRLNRDVTDLVTTKRELLQHIGRLESKHHEDMRKILEKSKRKRY